MGAADAASSAYEAITGKWSTDEDSSFTKAEDANNYLVEAAILAFQEATVSILQRLAELSATNEKNIDLLRSYRETTNIAYVLLLDGKADAAKKALRKVVGK